jgi:hypothetical protein
MNVEIEIAVLSGVLQRVLARLIQRMPGIRWRVSRKALIALRDWVSKPSCPRERAEPHPPCLLIRPCRSIFQPSVARS